jgi:uracil-DNA glycosylase family protein
MSTAAAEDRPGAERWVPRTDDVEALRLAAPDCRGCELWQPATQVVFGAGDPRAPMLMVGEQPGDVEDRKGLPFVGPAGRLLHEVMDDAGIPHERVYLTNAVKHFRYTPTGKRRMHEKPDLVHVDACHPWLDAELTVVDPRVVVVLGATAAAALLGRNFRVTQHRGEVIEQVADDGAPRLFVPTVHPSSVLRAGSRRAEARAALVADLRVARAAAFGA